MVVDGWNWINQVFQFIISLELFFKRVEETRATVFQRSICVPCPRISFFVRSFLSRWIRGCFHFKPKCFQIRRIETYNRFLYPSCALSLYANLGVFRYQENLLSPWFPNHFSTDFLKNWLIFLFHSSLIFSFNLDHSSTVSNLVR